MHKNLPPAHTMVFLLLSGGNDELINKGLPNCE
jgi:hypothetical protein